MGRTTVEFGDGELLIVGGDYGQIILAGASQEAISAVQQVVGAARYRGDGVVLQLRVDIEDSAAPVIEDRHAGLQGTNSRVPIDAGTSGSDPEEGLATKAAADGTAESLA